MFQEFFLQFMGGVRIFKLAFKFMNNSLQGERKFLQGSYFVIKIVLLDGVSSL